MPSEITVSATPMRIKVPKEVSFSPNYFLKEILLYHVYRIYSILKIY
jgi:hypothetical protein